MEQSARARLLVRSPIELGSLTHPLTVPAYITLPAATPPAPAIRPPSLSWKLRERRRRGESRYVGYFANSMSNRSHRSGRGSPSPLFWVLAWPRSCSSVRLSVRPAGRPAMGVQWHVPTTNSTPPSSFALFAECARERRTTDLFMCAACGAIVFQRSAGRGTQRNASSSRPAGRGRGWPVKMTKRGEKGNGRKRERESEKGNGDGVSNNASFMVLLCCVRKQIIECGAGGGSRMRHKIR